MQPRTQIFAVAAMALLLAVVVLLVLSRESPRTTPHAVGSPPGEPGEVQPDAAPPGSLPVTAPATRAGPAHTQASLDADREALLSALYAGSHVDDSLLGARLTLGRDSDAFDSALFLMQAYGLAEDDPVALAQVARFCFSPVARHPTAATEALRATCQGLEVVERLAELEAGNAWVHMLEAIRFDATGDDPAPALLRARDAVYFDDFDGRARLRILETVTRTTPPHLVEVVTRQAFAAHEILEVLAPMGDICMRSAEAESSCLAGADYFEQAGRPGARAVYLHLAGVDDPAAANLPLSLDEYVSVMAQIGDGDGLVRLLDDLARYEAGSALRLAGERYGVLQSSSWEPEPLGVTVLEGDNQ